MNQDDPTDHALAAIASILDQPDPRREAAEKPVVEPTPAMPPPGPPPLPAAEEDGYSKIGPGPIAAIRFKWTARQAANGDYFVEETIGESSTPVVAGPMTKEAAIQLVDEREKEARQRFDQLKHEMTGRAAAADLVRKGSSEA